jgi:Sec7-like guanine-nucleotide exchange factor
LDKYKETALEYQELQLVLDIIKDLVKIKELSKEHLTDVELQAKFISKTFKCVCSTAQMKGAARYKNPIKVRLERIKACT